MHYKFLHNAGEDLGGAKEASAPPSKFFTYMLLLLYAAWKFHSMMFNHLNYVYSYIIAI